MVKFITLAGQKQVGKDTSASMIRDILVPTKTIAVNNPNDCMSYEQETGPHARKVHIVHFADALKKACHFIFGISLEDMETEEGKQKVTNVRWPKSTDIVTTKIDKLWLPDLNGKNMTVREVLQFVGTDLFRNQLDPDIWLNSVFSKEYEDDEIVIIADARFPNEAELGREQGILIGINRETGIKGDGHKSETALNNYAHYHYVMENDGSFHDLKDQLEGILKREDMI